MKYSIALVGEAYGEQEERLGIPFVGPAGNLLNELLADAGILRQECFITNTFNFRPPDNKIEALCQNKAGVGGKAYHLPPIKSGCYIEPKYLGELDRLKKELEDVRPNVAVALGNIACWALLRNTGITSLRGTVCESVLVPGLKVLPTFHPSSLFHQYHNRPVTILDLQKAKVQSAFPEIKIPSRTIHVAETIEDLEFIERVFSDNRQLALDIETTIKQISCVGFSHDPGEAYVIPFIHWGRPDGSYWPTHALEKRAWLAVKKVCTSPAKKVGQNGLYDITYLWMKYGIPVLNYSDDTMLLHHALQPESPKSLGFLGSVYCDDFAWKNLRPRYSDKIKRDE